MFESAAGIDTQRPRWMVPYVLCLVLTGIGYVALLPPFEGFDEYAHYSSVRQIAHTGTLPVYGASFMDSEVTSYRGPAPYGSGTAPFRPLLGVRSYPEFFNEPDEVRQYLQTYAAQPIARFSPSQQLNWQAQHPPLYYLLMAPVVMVTDALPFLSQILVLRLVSYLLAMGGVLCGLAAIRNVATAGSAAQLGFLWYPLLLPEFFPEFARIGNDSLCLLLLGCLMYLVARSQNPFGPIDRPWLVGSILGLGLLTKAFFLPVTAAVIVWLVLCRLLRGTGSVPARVAGMRDIAIVITCALVLGGWWYVYNFFAFGEVTGGDQAIRFRQAGGLLAGLLKNFSVFAVLRGIVTIPVTWVWTGAWSLARLPEIMQFPVVILACWVAGEFLVRVRRQTLATLDGLTLLMMGAMCLGLAHRTVQGIASAGNGNQGGWYLHIFMPWVAVALGSGVLAIEQRPAARRLFLGLAAYTAIFHVAAIWAEASLFSGCATKGDDKLFRFSSPAYCLDAASLVFDRLRIVAWPSVAACAFGLALVGAALTAYLARQRGAQRIAAA